MPSKTAKQHRLMEAVAHNPAFAKKVGIPQSVGKDFSTADKGKKFGMGGGVGQTQGGKGMVNRQETRAGSVFGQKKEVPNINLNKYIGKKEGGMAKSDMKEDMKADVKQDKAIVKKAFKMHDKQEHKSGPGTDLSKLKKGGMAMKKMASGGETMGPRSMSKDVEKGSNKLTKFGESTVQKKGHTKGKNFGDTGPVKMRTGGKVRRYDEGGYTGDDEIVKYRMGMTDKPSPSEPAIEDESDRGNVSPAAAEFNKDTGNEPSTPKAAPKAVSKPVSKKETSDSAPKDSAPTKQQKAAPTMVKDQPFKSKSGMTGSEAKKVLFGSSSNDSPRMKAAKRDQAMSGNWSMKSGGKVGPSRGDGIAQRGRTKGKYC
jgi:hypothetical protein